MTTTSPDSAESEQGGYNGKSLAGLVCRVIIATGAIGAVVGAVTTSVLEHQWPTPPSVEIITPSGGPSTASAQPTPTPAQSDTVSPGNASSSPPSGSIQKPSPKVARVSFSLAGGREEEISVSSLNANLATVNRADYNVNDDVVHSDGSRCIAAVVVRGLRVPTASLIATGWPKGLFAAEGVPPQDVRSGEVHEQLLLLAEDALRAPRSIGAELVVNGNSSPLEGTASLKLVSVVDGVATLSLNGAKVQCEL